MEIRVNAVLLGALAIIWCLLTPSSPVAALDPDAASTHALAHLEDAFARNPSDRALAGRLANRYMALSQPGLAIAALRSADPSLLQDPMLTSRLAQAYEASGRTLDALDTAKLARSRCARSVGTADAPSATPVPRYACSAREMAALDMHVEALARMAAWGVTDPSRDPRTHLAYALAMRTARIASAQ